MTIVNTKRDPLTVGVVQHVESEGPAAIATWFQSRGHRLAIWKPYRTGSRIPSEVASSQVLVLMGGPMSANDHDELPWISAELDLVRDRTRAGSPILGVCLGAQLLAKSLGASVGGCHHREIGWYPVQVFSTPSSDDPWREVFEQPQAITVLHWHGETFSLPTGAVHRASSAACANQLFTVGDRLVGMQFHCESTQESVNALVTASAHEIGGGPFEMSASTITADSLRHEPSARPLLYRILSRVEHIAVTDQHSRGVVY